MKLNDSEDNKTSPQLIAGILGVGAVILIILLIVLVPNLDKLTSGNKKENTTNVGSAGNTGGMQTGQADNYGAGGSSPVVDDSNGTLGQGLTPSDLDFWELYPEQKDEPEEPDNVEETEAVEPIPEEDPSTDGKHTCVTLRDGTEEWVVISQYLPKNDYDYTGLVCKNNEMQYYVDGKKTSYFGIDISKYQDYMDFVKIKKAGVDFVMIRVGIRGYSTGQIVMDDYFYDNIKRAFDAGLDVGVYFSSQAVTKDEAIEEANTVIAALEGYNITYPVVFDMEFMKNDTARIEKLTKSHKTDITKAFLDTISAAGFNGMIYGDKEWLVKEIDMSKLTAYDVWLSQIQDLPDYPYKFSMWQYMSDGSIDGISGYVNLNISFVDYSEK